MHSDKISLFSPRMLSQSLELSFDFLRQNRRMWLQGTLLLLFPFGVLTSLFLQPKGELFNLDDAFGFIEQTFASNKHILAWGVYLAVTFSVSVVRSYDAGALPEKMGWRGLARMLRPCWIPVGAVVCMLYILHLMVWQVGQLSVLLLILTVPLWLLIPSLVLLKASFTRCLSLAFGRGMRSWFMLAFLYCFLCFLAGIMLISALIPFVLLGTLLNEFGLFNADFGQVFLRLFNAVAVSALVYVVLVAAAVFGNAISFLFGGLAASEAVTNLEKKIDNFDTL